MSGHSKWTQIKHKKGAADAKRGQLFSKLVREIMVAARDGGQSPDANARLRASIERARSLGLPKDNIERAIERSTGGGEGVRLEEFLYEAVGPFGASVLIEGITDSGNRTRVEIKKILAERGAKLAEPGSLLWNFEKTGFIDSARSGNDKRSDEEMELAIIESGAREFQRQGNGWIIETEFHALENVRRGLEKQSFLVKEFGHDYKAKSPLEIPAEERRALEPLLNELSEHDDVQKVYTNLTDKP